MRNERVVRRRAGILAALVALGLVWGYVVPVLEAPPAAAADAGTFRPGSIISDALFFDGAAMSAADVQWFLNVKRPDCAAGYTCLKDYVTASQDRPVEAGLCNGYAGVAAETAAQIVAKVGASCGVSQKALLVTLQKEQGLVTSRSPSASAYRIAMGFGCPDTAPCDTQYYGFFNQVYRAARQFKRYAASPSSYSYRAGRVNSILFSPNGDCSRGDVYIENQATAGLYSYTPYQPNAAALGNLYGAGDGCSSYGNRNFWRDYTDWFGSTQVGANLVRTTGDPTVYLVTFDHKFPVADLDTLDSLSSLGQVGYVDPSFLAARATGSTLGRFIRDQSGYIWLVDRGWIFQVRDCNQLADWGASCSSYGSMALTDVQMSGFVKAGMLSSVVATPEGKRFAVYGGQKHEVADDAALGSAPVSGPAIGLREAALAGLPYGAPLVHDGLLLRNRTTGEDFLTDEGAVLRVAAGLTASTRLASLPLAFLDPPSLAALPAPTSTLQGVLKVGSAAYGLSGGGLAPLASGVLDQPAADAPTISAALSQKLGVTASGSVLVRTPSVPTLYLATGGRRREIRTMDDARLVAGAAPTIVYLSDASLAPVPVGSPILSPGTLVKAADASTVYLVDGLSTLVPLPSFAVSDALGISGWSTVPAASFADYNVAAAPLGTVVGCGSTRYVGVSGSRLGYVGSPASVDASGIPITTLDPLTCTRLPATGTTTSPLFVKSLTKPDVFVASAGAKRPVASMDIAYSVAAGSSFVVALVDQSLLDAVPTGVPVLKPGTLVKAADSPEIYLVDGLTSRIFVPSFDITNALEISGWAEVPASSLAPYSKAPAPLTTAWSCRSSRFIGYGGSLSQIDTGLLDASGVPETQVDWSTCQTVRHGGFVTGPVLAQEVGSPTIYAVSDGVRHPVASMDRVYQLTMYTFPKLALVPAGALAGLPIGNPA